MAETTKTTDLDTLFEAGAHFGYTRSRRHPSATSFLFGTKDRNDIFDLERTQELLGRAAEFVGKLASEGKTILFVGGKEEIAAALRTAAERAEQPYVAGRWIGGTLSNFSEIKKRLERHARLVRERDSGERETKYTKRERLTFDREIEELEGRFGGIVGMDALPAALLVVDTRHEDKAVREANQLGIPVIGIANTDCDFSRVQYPVPANDSAIKSVRLFLDMLVEACVTNKRAAPAPEKEAA